MIWEIDPFLPITDSLRKVGKGRFFDLYVVLKTQKIPAGCRDFLLVSYRLVFFTKTEEAIYKFVLIEDKEVFHLFAHPDEFYGNFKLIGNG